VILWVTGMVRAASFGFLVATVAAAQTVDFNREIRPIFSDRCYTCHGPAQSTRRSPLRFDTEEGAKQKLGNHFAIVPGEPANSELIRRITAPSNSPMRMPPASAGQPLNEKEVDLLRRWIAQGAGWEKHWSFIPVKPVSAPPVREVAWVRTPIDSFILARLEKDRLSHAPEASKETLLRRVSFDLTGIPPTPA
jgi:mono/diheme cytochrome c family protein